MRAVGLAKAAGPALGIATVAAAGFLLRNRLVNHRKPTLAEVQAAIDLNSDLYIDALCNGDADAYVDLFLPNAVSLPSHGPVLRGRAAIRENISATFRTLRYVDGDMQTIETLLSDDGAYEIGRYEFETVRKWRRKPEVIKGRYVVVWAPVGDQWKIMVDAGQAGAPAF